MSKVFLKFMSYGLLLWGVLFFAACGSDSELACETESDCDPGYTCMDGTCQARYVECFLDNDCGANHLECSTDGLCVERTSCDSDAQCASGKTCASGTCTERQCEEHSDCVDPSHRCHEGVCRHTPAQCVRAGGSCDPDVPNHLGFTCADLGEGPTCYHACEYAGSTNASTGEAETVFACPSEHLCVTEGLEVPVCNPGECGGYFEGQEACEAIAAENPAQFPNGTHCALAGDEFGNTAHRCFPAGLGKQGSGCSSVLNCAEGQTCMNYIPIAGRLSPQNGGACGLACLSDDDCSDGQGCIGASAGLYAGVGVCGNRCDPFVVGADQCDDGIGCMPVSADDGICFQPGMGEKEMYDTCTPAAGIGGAGCPSGTMCIGIGGEGRCAPYCDPAAADPDSTCPQGDGKSFFSLMHFAQDLGTVDIYVDGELFAEGVDFGQVVDDSGAFFARDPGEVRIALSNGEVVAGEPNMMYETTVDLADNGVAHLVFAGEGAGGSSGTLQVLNVAEPRDAILPAGESAEIRFVHGLSTAGNVDILAIRDGAPFDASELHIVLAENLSLYETTEFVAVATDLGDDDVEAVYNVYFFEAAADRSEDNALAIHPGFALNSGDLLTVYLSGENVEKEIVRENPDEPANPIVEIIEVLDVEFTVLPYRFADSSRTLGGYCYNALTGGVVPGGGFCLEKCTTTDQFGEDVCSGDGNSACRPVGAGMGWCMPAGVSETGSSCTNDAQCAPGNFCDQSSAGGTCRSYCDVNGSSNPSLTCASGETCFGIAGYESLGECRIACEPGEDYRDLSCPENQQSCYESNGQAFCRPSGSISEGENCGSPTTQNCEAGNVCAKTGRDLTGVIIEPFSELQQGEPQAVCRPLCEPFKGTGESDCPSDMRCSPIMPGGDYSTTVGHCVPAGDMHQSLTECTEMGTMCGENAFCIDNGGSPLCVQLCDWLNDRGCTDDTSCNAWSSSGPLVGVYGLCG